MKQRGGERVVAIAGDAVDGMGEPLRPFMVLVLVTIVFVNVGAGDGCCGCQD